jgi:hypothetical protein
MSTRYGKKRYDNGLRVSREHFILMELESLWTIGPNALKRRRLFIDILYIVI